MKDVLHIYMRVSTTIQEEGTSLKTQRETGIELAKKLGMKFEIHNEGGSSSARDTLDNRPVLMNILRMMDEGVINNLYVWNTDRLSRNQVTWYTIRQVMLKNKVTLFTSNGKYESSDFLENMILGILSEVSQYDNQVRTERSRLGKIERVKMNYWMGGDTPYGYGLSHDGRGNRLVENELESKWVRYIYSEYSKRTPLKDIKSVLEQNGVKTRRENKYWSMGSLQVLLRNETYLGTFQFVDKKTQLTIRNPIPQIISNKLWDEVQERRNVLLKRKNQFNRSTKFYLFRDFLVCKCGTMMGGRMKPKKFVQHYYCPLPERKFNNSNLNDKKCDMKRCMNIQTTDRYLWNIIIDILSNTMELKQTLKEKTIFGMGLRSSELKQEIKSREERIKELTNTKNELEKGLVEVETNHITHKYPSEEIYHSLKKEFTKRYYQTKSEIEDIKNSLREIGNQEQWFEWIDIFGDKIRNQRELPDILKKQLLEKVLDFISVDYDWEDKVHRLKIHFKLPVFQLGNGVKNGKTDKYLILKPLETSVNQPDQNTTLPYYSTVITSPPKGVTNTVQGRYKPLVIGRGVSDGKNKEYNATKGYSLRMSVELVSANLWESPYTLYQQELYGIIRKCHEEDGWNFKQISDWLNDNGYKSPRGKVLKENHVWSIYIKKQRSIQRFSREYEHKVTDMKVDVVDIVPTKNENGI
jgi:site-specific DNA recombinase